MTIGGPMHGACRQAAHACAPPLLLPALLSRAPGPWCNGALSSVLARYTWPLPPAAPSHLWHAPTCVGGAATSGRVRHAELGRALGQGCHDAKDCAARWNPAGAQRVASASPMLTVFVAPPASRTSLSSHFFVAKPPMVPAATQSVTLPPFVACPAPQPARTRCRTCGKSWTGSTTSEYGPHLPWGKCSTTTWPRATLLTLP